MSFFFPNTFRKAAEADIDHSRYAPNLWIFWSYTLYDFWTVIAVGFVIYLLFLWGLSPAVAAGTLWTSISALLFIANAVSIATIFRRAQRAFAGKSDKEISDIPFAFGAILMLLATFHFGFLSANILASLIW